MRSAHSKRWVYLLIPGAVMMQLSGCLGPNPGFFVGSTVAGTTISALTNAFLNNILALGG
ncbi:MAG: hypothetical protein IID37_10165 [Planctomycetes bacterium]|nr:hypothetical protein [Planctomycetota bacterium]